MIRIARPLLPLALVLLCCACSKSAPPAAPAPAAPAPAAAAPASNTAMSAAPAPVSKVAADAPIPVMQGVGVAECDVYLSKYEACINSKVPDTARAAFAQGLEQTRSAWRTAAASPAGKSALANACIQAQDATRKAMAQYGCTDL